MPKVSLIQLAGQLGASLSTVSKLPYNSYETGAETKQRVLQMAEQIGYQASPYTGRLRHHKGRTIAVFVPELSNNFLIQASGDAESVAREQDYHILFYVTQKDFRQKDRMLKHLSMGRVRWHDHVTGSQHQNLRFCTTEEADGNFTVVYTAMTKVDGKSLYAIGKCTLAWQ